MGKVTAMTALGSISIFLLRDFIISIVFTHQFQPVKGLLTFQLVGDVLKMAGWPLRMALVIKLRSTWYMLVEIGVTIAQVGMTYFLLPRIGLEAATVAYALAWGATLIVLLYAFKGYWYGLHRKEI